MQKCQQAVLAHFRYMYEWPVLTNNVNCTFKSKTKALVGIPVLHGQF